jgi:hypothetical protein
MLSGCASPQPPAATPTPAATVTATATPAPTPGVNESVQMQYSYVEKFQAGIGHYNAGIDAARRGQALFNGSDFANASRQMAIATESMGVARASFQSMAQYAQTPQERNLSEKWQQTAEYARMGYQNASYAYLEYANQTASPPPNWVKYNAYVAQANQNNLLAEQAKQEAEAIERTITLFVPGM